jgi:hypothetical protein
MERPHMIADMYKTLIDPMIGMAKTAVTLFPTLAFRFNLLLASLYGIAIYLGIIVVIIVLWLYIRPRLFFLTRSFNVKTYFERFAFDTSARLTRIVTAIPKSKAPQLQQLYTSAIQILQEKELGLQFRHHYAYYTILKPSKDSQKCKDPTTKIYENTLKSLDLPNGSQPILAFGDKINKLSDALEKSVEFIISNDNHLSILRYQNTNLSTISSARARTIAKDMLVNLSKDQRETLCDEMEGIIADIGVLYMAIVENKAALEEVMTSHVGNGASVKARFTHGTRFTFFRLWNILVWQPFICDIIIAQSKVIANTFKHFGKSLAEYNKKYGFGMATKLAGNLIKSPWNKLRGRTADPADTNKKIDKDAIIDKTKEFMDRYQLKNTDAVLLAREFLQYETSTPNFENAFNVVYQAVNEGLFRVSLKKLPEFTIYLLQQSNGDIEGLIAALRETCKITGKCRLDDAIVLINARKTYPNFDDILSQVNQGIGPSGSKLGILESALQIAKSRKAS